MRIKLEWPSKFTKITWAVTDYDYVPDKWEDYRDKELNDRRIFIERLKVDPDCGWCKEPLYLKQYAPTLPHEKYIDALRIEFSENLALNEYCATSLRSRKWRCFFEQKREVLCFRNASDHELDFKVRLPRTASWSIFELENWAGECEISHWFIDTVRYGDIDNILGARPGKHVTTWGWHSTQVAFNSNTDANSICIKSFSGGVLRIHSLR